MIFMMKQQDLLSPSLLLDINQMDNNINDIVQFAHKYGVNYRPHVKTHKCIEIARRQLKAGAIGITVATVGEAEVMVHGGIDDILIAFPISLESQFKRVLKLLKHAHITVAVDSHEQATLLQDFYKKHDYKLNVWIKVNSGLNRCGVQPNDEVLGLAQHIIKLDSLLLDGLFTHAGQSYTAISEGMLDDIAHQEADAIISRDRKSTRLNSSHVAISYAVFCLKKKKK